MVDLALVVAVAQLVTLSPGMEAVSGLEGCWRVTGQVQGEDAPGFAKGEWRLGRRYLMLHLRVPRPGDEDESAITYGAGEQPYEIGSLFSDTFGGLYGPSLGAGTATEAGFEQRYPFPEPVYLSRFQRQQGGWRWTILEQIEGREDQIFADYRLESASCAGMDFYVLAACKCLTQRPLWVESRPDCRVGKRTFDPAVHKRTVSDSAKGG